MKTIYLKFSITTFNKLPTNGCERLWWGDGLVRLPLSIGMSVLTYIVHIATIIVLVLNTCAVVVLSSEILNVGAKGASNVLSGLKMIYYW